MRFHERDKTTISPNKIFVIPPSPHGGAIAAAHIIPLDLRRVQVHADDMVGTCDSQHVGHELG